MTRRATTSHNRGSELSGGACNLAGPAGEYEAFGTTPHLYTTRFGVISPNNVTSRGLAGVLSGPADAEAPPLDGNHRKVPYHIFFRSMVQRGVRG